MYHYTELDQHLIDERVAEFSNQTERFLKGELSEEEFRPLRLMNGLYIQRHAPMLRVAIPYGLLNSKQLRMLANIAERYDKAYGHFTTRQNIQFNWIALENAPRVLANLASVQMHAIQTSGNCIRNVTADHLAGACAQEVEDPRPYCELIRHWSTFHPEFSFLPRKFKIAISGAEQEDRAAVRWHDVGLFLVKHPQTSEIGFKVLVGGGMGRTPFAGKVVRDFLPKQDVLSYLESILRIYNEQGRRDNMYKARIKILVNALGIEKFKTLVEKEWAVRKKDYRLPEKNLSYFQSQFPPLAYTNTDTALDEIATQDDAFLEWFNQNTLPHKHPAHRIVMVSLKTGKTPAGDVSAAQMRVLADLADAYSFSMLRTTHDQNMAMTDVPMPMLYALWQQLKKADLATPNIGTMTDLICCPGFDFCSLANAPTLDLSMQIQAYFESLKGQYNINDIGIKMSGCMNACAHHHASDIGILGVDKKGEYYYQVALGGSAPLGVVAKVVGPAVSKEQLLPTLDTIFKTYMHLRQQDEKFFDCYHRLGPKPFKERIYQ